MVEVLSDLSEALAGAVAAAAPSVVRIEGRKRLPASGIVWSSDGVVVTAHHTLEHEENIVAGLENGETVPATLVGRDATTDLAVLRLSASSLVPPTWADPEALRVGHLALALGRPGQTVRATMGIVSALGKAWYTPAGGRIAPYLQADVAMYPGFSGGPLGDANGKFLGLNGSALLRGVSVAVPAPTLRRVVESLLAHGKVRRGYLGLGNQPVRLPAVPAERLGQETGLLLVSVAPGSPAEQHGLHLGDTIVSLDGQPVGNPDELLALLSDDRIGKAVPVGIVRGGNLEDLTVTVGERA